MAESNGFNILAALTTPDNIDREIKEIDQKIEWAKEELLDLMSRRDTLMLARFAYEHRAAAVQSQRKTEERKS